MLVYVMSTKETTAREYAAREDKAARFAAYFHAHGVTSAQVRQMPLDSPWWRELAAAISAETGRKLLPPHSPETVEAICRNLQYYEEAKR